MSIIQTSEDESHRANATMTLVRETSIYDLNGAAEKVVPDLENAQDEYLRLFCGGDWIRSGLDGKNSLFEYLLEDSGACAITRKTGLNFGQEFVKAGSCCVQDCPTFWVPTITEFSLHLNADTPYYFAPPYSLVKRCARLAE
ncbi:unnamed protein product [Amoebophrya sp. A120]|nr:unnamed protein product [Amoebophrya sp. A120]|eukprot:GSA120T00003859001.1